MSFPDTDKLARIKSMLGRNPRVIVCGDSYYEWQLARMFIQLMTGLDHGRVTAMTRGFNNSTNPTPGPVWSSDLTTSSNSYTVDMDNDNEVLTGEYFGLAGPMGGIRVIPFDGTTTFGNNGVFAYIGSQDNIGGHEGDLFTDDGLKDMAVRVLYYCPTDIADLNDRDIRIHDRQDQSGQTITATANLTTGSRKFHHLDEGDPDAATGGAPVTGHINAMYPDYVLDNPTGATPPARFLRMIDEDYTAANQAATPNTGKYNPIAGAVFYEVDDSDNRVDGTYYQFLAESGLGFDDHWGENAAATSLEPRQFTEAQLRHLLDVTTLDKDQPTIIIGSGDNENRDVADIQAGVSGWMSMVSDALDAIGVSEYQFLTIHSHARQIGALTGQALIDANDKMGQAMYNASSARSDASFMSVQKALSDALMEGDAEADAAVNALGLNPLTFGTVSGVTVTGKDMVADNTHPTDEDSAAFFGAVVNYEISNAGASLDPSILKPGMIVDDSTLKPGLVNSTYTSGAGDSDTLKAGLLDSDGNLKSSLLDADGSLKPGLLR